MVLTEPGLVGIVAAVKEGRATFQRILTYTLNSITKKIVQVLFLAVGLIMTGHAILTPLLMVLIMITGDFLGMSMSTDNVRPSPQPNRWQIGNLTVAGIVMGIGELIFCTSVLVSGAYWMGFRIAALRWSSRPSIWVVVSSVGDVLIASTLAIGGIAMTALPAAVVAGTLVAAIVFAVLLDFIKVPVFHRLRIT